MITLLASLVFVFSSHAFDADAILDSIVKDEVESNDPWPNKAEVDKKMQDISDKLAGGIVPLPSTTTEYYSGACLTSYSAAAVPPVYSATVAIRSSTEGFQIAYSTGQGVVPQYTAKDIPSLDKRYTPKTKPMSIMFVEELQGSFATFVMAPPSAEFPAIMSALSVDKNDKNKMYFVAMLMGYYCELDRVR